MARLRCAGCDEYFYYREYVYLDFWNTLTHKECYNGRFEKIDEGTYYDIIYKYHFFSQFQPLFPFKQRGEMPTNQFVYIKERPYSKGKRS